MRKRYFSYIFFNIFSFEKTFIHHINFDTIFFQLRFHKKTQHISWRAFISPDLPRGYGLIKMANQIAELHGLFHSSRIYLYHWFKIIFSVCTWQSREHNTWKDILLWQIGKLHKIYVNQQWWKQELMNISLNIIIPYSQKLICMYLKMNENLVFIFNMNKSEWSVFLWMFCHFRQNVPIYTNALSVYQVVYYAYPTGAPVSCYQFSVECELLILLR